MENRAPASSGVRKPRARRKRGAGIWIALGLTGLALAGAGLWLSQDGGSEGLGTPLTDASSAPVPAATESLPAPPVDTEQAEAPSAPSSEVIAGTADADPPAEAQAKIVEADEDNPFAVIDKGTAAPAPAKAAPATDPFAVVAKATPAPAPAPAPARTADDNPFAAVSAPRAATPPAAKPAAADKPKPVAAAPKPAAKADSGAKVATRASEPPAPAPAGTDLLTHLQQSIQTANQGGAAAAPVAPTKDKAPAAKPLQRKTSGTDAEVLDDLVKQVNTNRETVETISGGASAAGELLNKKN